MSKSARFVKPTLVALEALHRLAPIEGQKEEETEMRIDQKMLKTISEEKTQAQPMEDSE